MCFFKIKISSTSYGCCSSESTNEAIKYVFTFFYYHYLKLGVVQTKSVFHLRFQESISLLRETRALFSEAHTPSAPHYSFLPPHVAHGFSLPIRRVGELFLHFLLPQQPSSSSHWQTDAGVCVFLHFGQWVFHNIESWAFYVPSYKTLSSFLVLLHLFQSLYKLSVQHCGRIGTLCVTRLFSSLQLSSCCGGHCTWAPDMCSISSSTGYPTRSSTGYPTHSSTGYPTRSSTGYPIFSSTEYPTRSSTEYPSRSSTGWPAHSSTGYPTHGSPLPSSNPICLLFTMLLRQYHSFS